MFKHAFHGGNAVEIFTTAGKDPLKNFKIDGSSKNVVKYFEGTQEKKFNQLGAV